MHCALRVVEQIAVDAADAGDHSVGRRALDQVVERAAAALRRDHQRRRTRRTCRGRRGPRYFRARCADRSCAGARPPRAARHRARSRDARSTSARSGRMRSRSIAFGRGAVDGLTVGLFDEGERMRPRRPHRPRRPRSAARCRCCAARMTCSIFIASMTKSCWPRCTASPSRTSIETIVPCIGAATATVPSGPAMS